MADIRIKDLPTTATQTASDDFIALDGTVNGTRKIDASAPSFKTSVTSPSIVAPAATNLTLAGGSTGASLVLGQGVANASLVATPAGLGAFLIGSAANQQSGRLQITSATGNAVNLRSTDTTTGAINTGATILWTGHNGSAAYNSGSFAILKENGTSGNSASYAVISTYSAGGGAITEAGRFTSTGNLLIGGTTDITGSGGLKVFGTTAALNTASGALQVAGGVGVAGAGYFGGSVNVAASGGTFVANSGSNSNQTALSLTNGGAGGTNYQIQTSTSAGSTAGGLLIYDNTAAGSVMSFAGTSRNVTVHATTSASSSTVGALTIGNGTAATNVAIGGGNVNAGGTLTSGSIVYSSTTATGSAVNTAFSLRNNATASPNNNLPSISWDTASLNWARIDALRNAAGGFGGTMRFWTMNGAGTEISRMTIGDGNGDVSIASTQPSTGVGTGALQVAGGIYAGAASVFAGNLTVGNSNVNQLLTLQSATAGTGQGAALVLKNNTTTIGYFGRSSYISSGAVNTDAPAIAGTTGLGLNFFVNDSTNALALASTGGATFAGAVTVGGTLTLPKAPAAANRYILTGTDATGTGQLSIQAGGGSTSWGGTLNLFETAHATKGGWVGVGLGVSGAKFTINSVGFSESGEVASIDRAGAATFAGAVTVNNKIIGVQAGAAATAIEGARLTNTTTTGSVYLNFNETNSTATPAYLIRYGSTHASSPNILELAATGTGAKFRVLPAMSISDTTAGSAGAGALVVSGGLATGAASYFGGDVSVPNLTATNGLNCFALSIANDNAALLLKNTAGTTKAQLTTNSGSTYFDYLGSLFIRAGFGGTTALTLASTGAATFAGAVTAGAITSTGASAALNVNGTSGAVIATVSSGSSIAGGGQGILSLNISDQLWSVRNAGGPFGIRDDTSGNYYLNITRATGAVRFHAYGAGTATFDSSGNITSVSDARLKNITGTFTKGLAEIVKLTPKLYTWKPDTGLVTDDINATLIAQDLIAAGLPEAVTTYRTVAVMEDDVQSAEDIAAGKPVTQHAKLDADGKPVTQRVDANYSVSDRTVIAALVNAVKELKAEIDALKAAK